MSKRIPGIIGLCRVSTDGQEKTGLGLDAQRAAIHAYAEKRGMPVREVFSECVSRSAPMSDRPILVSALDALRRGDVLVVHKRDRLSCDALVVWVIEDRVARRGATIVSTIGEASGDDSPQGKAFRRFMDVLNQLERDMAVARTKAAMAQKKQRGELCSRHPPFGMRVDPDGKTLVKDDKEQAAIIRIKAMRQGGQSYPDIDAALIEAGLKPRFGYKWHPRILSKIVSS